MADVADVLGISENVARRHHARWSAARQARISTIMRLVHDGGPVAAATSQLGEQDTPVIQQAKIVD
jgi:hypothetical protein